MEAAPLRGTEQVAAGLHARRQPILATPRVRPLPGIGDLGRAARHFSALTFLSGTARRALDASYRGVGVGSLLVRPPDYWSGHRDDELGIARKVSTGDVALDRLVSRRAALRHQATPALRRGLPSTIHRRGYSLAGPMTAPGGMARRLQPASVVPMPNPANSPQTAAARSPRSKPAPRVGGREADPSRPGSRPGPALPPAAAGAVARAEAPGRTTSNRSEVVPPSATRSAPVGPPAVDGLAASSSRASSSAPDGRRSPADMPAAASEVAGRDASSRASSAGRAAAPGGSIAGEPVARRSGAELPAGASEVAGRGTSASVGSAGRAAAPGGSIAGEPVARRSGAELPAGASEVAGRDASSRAGSAGRAAAPGGSVAGEAVARRSAAPSELDPAGPGTAPFWVTASTPAGAVPRQADVDHDDPTPVWPGDVTVADQSPATAVERGVGRPVAVRPLLSGWRSPTAWRSIAAGPGVRLLPVSSSAMSPAWMAARSTTSPASWADQVRRATDEGIPSSDATRRLPVGGPTVVVRESAATAGVGAQRPAPVTAASRRADEVAQRSASAAASRADAAWRAAAAAVERADAVARRTGSASGSPASASPTDASGRSAAVERADAVARRSGSASDSPASASRRSAADEVARRSAAAGSLAAASGRSGSAAVGSADEVARRSAAAGSLAAASGRSGSAAVGSADEVARRSAAAGSLAAASGRSGSAAVGSADEVARRSAAAAASVTSTTPIRRAELDLATAGGWTGPATSWSSLPAGSVRAGGPTVLLRRQVTGSGVSVSAWVPAPGSVAAGFGSPSAADTRMASPSMLASLTAPGSRAAEERRPGRWLARAAGPRSAAVPTGVQRMPMGPLGPVRWSVRADEPVVARSSLGGSAWSASVAAASAAMASGVPTGDGSIRPPVSGGLTLVRGGRAGGGDLPVASVQRAGNHPAAARLRLVPPSAAAAAAAEVGAAPGRPTVDGQTTAPLELARSAVPPYVGRAPMGTASFVSAPGAVAAHGLPAATASLVGVTASGAVSGRPTTPGALGRLVHGQTVVRRSVFEPAPPVLVLGARSSVPTPAARSMALGLPMAPAAAARRQARTLSPGASGELAATTPDGRSRGVAAGMAAATPARAARVGRLPDGTSASLPILDRTAVTGPSGPTTWAQRVASLAAGTVPTPRAAASTWTTGATDAGPRVASLRHLPVAPAAFAVVGSAGPVGRPGAPAPGNGRGPVGPGREGRSGDRHQGTSGDLAGGRSDRASIVHRSRTPHGLTATVARHRSAAGAAPTVAQRWLATDVPSRALPGLAPSRLRPLLLPSTVARASGGNASTAGTGRNTTSAAGTSPRTGAVRAAGVGGNATPAGGATRDAAPAGGIAQRAAVAPPAGASRSPATATAAGPGRATAPPMVEHRPLRPDAPASAGRFEEVLRSIDQSVRPVALPVRFRPLAERIVGRMPVQIATGVASRRALASVGAAAATTGSVIHLPSAPDSSARMAGILAHELTHVAAASPVARFHGGRPSVEETRANQVERIVARAARTVGTGRGPTVIGTRDLPVAGFVGPRGATSGPPVPASAQAAPAVSPGAVSADQLARRLSGGGSTPSSSGADRTVRRSPAPSAPAAVDRTGGAEDRVIRRLAEPMGLDQGVEASDDSDDTGMLSEQMMDAIVQAIEARLLESIERRGGLWRGGF